MRPSEEFKNGVSNRPPTPKKFVISNCYALWAEMINQDAYATETQKFEESKKNLKKI